jgi:hypothetical protein
MGWQAQQFKKSEHKRVRHARLHPGSSRCQDCQRDLRAVHEITRFFGRCRGCWSAFVADSEVTLVGGW